jgi:sigma-B regulation protein RsbU (phosphoserine phosphatase)
MKKGSLRKKIILGFFLFEALLILFVSFMVGYNYYKYRMDEYEEIVYRYLKSASEFIDGDTIRGYMETGKTDNYYDEVLTYLDSSRKVTEIVTFCVFVPLEDEVVYIWMSSEGESSYKWLGKTEEYMENGKETRDQTFRKNPTEKVSKYDYEGDTILAGFYPIFDSTGEPVALVDVDLSFPDTMRTIIIFIIMIVVGIIVISIIIGRLLYKYFDHILIKPIDTLNREARLMVENLDNDEIKMTKISSGDELEELYESFYQMNVDVRRYIKENIAIAAEKERIGADLQLASKIQRGILPGENDVLQDVQGFSLYASMTPAKEVGGDFYDFYMIDDKRLVIEIADVSDKGAAAALFMAIAKTLIKSRAGMGGSSTEILEYVDKMIVEKNSEGMFVTVWFAIIDLETGKVDVCNAGHDYPAIMKKGQDYVIEKTVHGCPIGFIPGAKQKSYEMTLEPGDRIFLYTDGVNESKRPDGERFGFERLLNELNLHKEMSDKDLVKTVTAAVYEFAGEEPQFDDMTALSFTFEGRKEG